MKRPVKRNGIYLVDADNELICDAIGSNFHENIDYAHLDEIAACVNIVPELIPVMERAAQHIREMINVIGSACVQDSIVMEDLKSAIREAKGCIK